MFVYKHRETIEYVKKYPTCKFCKMFVYKHIETIEYVKKYPTF